MKKLFLIALCLLMAFSFVSCKRDNYYKRTDFTFDFMLYSKIECNGIIYCRYSDSDRPKPYNRTKADIPVFIIDDKGKTRTDRVRYAAALVGDDDHEYLIFDSSIFLRNDLFEQREARTQSWT